ncbi:MAG: hypothetical protein QXG02_03240 [Candidatus Anstonellales archaeon]
MLLPFSNPFETKMRRVVERIKNGEKIKKPKWMDKDVLDDLHSAVEYSKLIEKSMGSELVFGILFGGVVRTPFESHIHSDIDLMLIYQKNVIFIPSKNSRVSVISYPQSFFESMIKSDKPESAFIRDVLLQAHAVLVGDQKKASLLRDAALQNFSVIDLVPLIIHRIKKSGLSIDEKGIGFAIEMLGVDSWVFSNQENLKIIMNAIFEANSSAANING